MQTQTLSMNSLFLQLGYFLLIVFLLYLDEQDFLEFL